MKNKLFVFLLMVAVAGFMIGLDYTEVQALARSNATSAVMKGQVATDISDAVGHRQESPGWPNWWAGPPPMNLFCTSGPCTAHGSWAQAHSQAWLFWKVSVADSLKIAYSDWGSGLKNPGFIDVVDTIYARLYYTMPTVTCSVWARLKTRPYCWNARSFFDLIVYKKTSLIEIGKAYGMLAGKDYTGSIPADSVKQVGDSTTIAYIQWDTTFTYAGPDTDLAIALGTLGEANINPSMPTMTQWGIIILVALIVTSGVFIMLRRRKAAVPA